MDVDMIIKSSASTALDLHHHHPHHHLDMMAIMMQMEKPTTTSPDDQFCDPNYQTKPSIIPSSFLDINTFSDSPPAMFQNPSNTSSSSSSCSSSSSFMGTLMNNGSPNQEPMMMGNSGRLFKGNVGIGATASGGVSGYEKRSGSMAAMREMIFRIAAMQPIHIDPEAIKPPKRRNVRISKDPQSVAARHRRERISERIRILQRLVPGGTKMDTASMLDEAIHYVKFLKKQVQTLEQAGAARATPGSIGFPVPAANANYSSFLKAANCQPSMVVGNSPMVESMRMLR